jgi:hypothetical protein
LSTFGVPLLGEVQVVLVQRVFGVGPAADVALGQVRALALLGAVLIGEGGAAADVGFDVEVHDQRGVERNCEVGGTKAFGLAQPCGGFAHQAYARAALILRHALHVEHGRAGGVIRLHRRIGDLAGPARIEHRGRRHRRHVGVDQRSTADSRAGNHGHAIEAPQIRPPVIALGMLPAPDPVVFGFARVGGFIPAAATLKHPNLSAFLRQSAGRDGAAKAAADNQNVTVHERARQQNCKFAPEKVEMQPAFNSLESVGHRSWPIRTRPQRVRCQQQQKTQQLNCRDRTAAAIAKAAWQRPLKLRARYVLR